MRFLRVSFWILLFAAMTFTWFVLFEYGFSPDRFKEGARTEWGRLIKTVTFGSYDPSSQSTETKQP